MGEEKRSNERAKWVRASLVYGWNEICDFSWDDLVGGNDWIDRIDIEGSKFCKCKATTRRSTKITRCGSSNYESEKSIKSEEKREKKKWNSSILFQKCKGVHQEKEKDRRINVTVCGTGVEKTRNREKSEEKMEENWRGNVVDGCSRFPIEVNPV